MPEIYRDGELWLYGYVGDSMFDEGFTASEVMEALAEHGRDEDLVVHLNSGGGNAFDGLAIYNALSAHKGEVRVEVDAIAASAAFTIMMAGDKIVMRAGSIAMAHDPSSITIGTADDHTKSVEMLDKLGRQMASIYAERSGKDPDEVRQSMKDELWLTAAEAVEEGYADEAEAAKAKPVAAFPYNTAYAHAPKRLVAMAKAKNWCLPDADHADTSAPPQKESSMTEKERADALAAEVADLKAKLEASAADKPEPGLSEQAAAEIADICMAANAPGLIATLIREKATKEQATARANAVGQIRQMVADAGKVTKSIEASMADDMIKRGLSVEKAREEVFAKLVANQSPEIDTQNPNIAPKSEAVQAAAGMVANMKKLIGKEAV